MATDQLEQINENTDIALIPSENDKQVLAILQEEDLKELKESLSVLSKFKRTHKLEKLRVTDIADKKQLEKLRVGIKDVRDEKTSLDQKRKEKNKPYADTIAFINSNYNNAIEIATALLEPLKIHQAEVKDLIEKKEREAQEMKTKRLHDRVDSLGNAGASFDGNYYSIGSQEFEVPETSLGIVDIEAMTDELFDKILSDISSKNEIIKNKQAEKEIALAEEKRIAQEKADLEQAQFKKDQEELAVKKAEFEKEQAEFKEQFETLQKEKELLAKQKMEAIAAEEKELADKKIKAWIARKAQLTEMGLVYSPATNVFILGTIKVDNLDQVGGLSDAEWDELVKFITPAVVEHKLEIEKTELKEKHAADMAIADKAIEDKRLADIAEEKRKAEELAKQGDRAVWKDYIHRLRAVTMPVVTTEEYGNKKRDADNLLKKISDL